MNFLKYLIISLVAATGFSACGDDVTEEYYTGSEVITQTYTIEKDDWEWNPVYNRYEYIKNVSIIDKDLYEYGTIVGTVFVVEEDGKGGTYEVQKNLPFVQTYTDLTVPYSEVISFDIFYGNPSSVTFYIQATDGTTHSPYLADYTFKVAYIWDRGY